MAEPLAFWTTLWRILSMHWYAALLLLLDIVVLVPMTRLFVVHSLLVGLENWGDVQIARNMTTQEYRKANYKIVSNPVYDKGVWKNFRNELFTYPPSLLATTVPSSKRTDVERQRSFNVSCVVCLTPVPELLFLTLLEETPEGLRGAIG